MIKVFVFVLFKSAFPGDTINGYWVKSMAINAVADLEDHLYCKNNRDREIIFKKSLPSLSSTISGKIYPCEVLAFSIDHLIFESNE